MNSLNIHALEIFFIISNNNYTELSVFTSIHIFSDLLEILLIYMCMCTHS